MILQLVLDAAAANASPLGDGIHFTPVQIVIGFFAAIGASGGVIQIINGFRGWGKDKDAGLKQMRDDIVDTMRKSSDAMEARVADLHRQTCEDMDDLEKKIGKIGDKVDTFMPAEKIEGLVKTGVDGLKHNHSQELQKQLIRIERLESGRTADVERIVKLESNMSNIEKSQTRIEHAVEGLSKELGARIDGWADKLSTSIREVRDVKPRG